MGVPIVPEPIQSRYGDDARGREQHVFEAGSFLLFEGTPLFGRRNVLLVDLLESLRSLRRALLDVVVSYERYSNILERSQRRELFTFHVPQIHCPRIHIDIPITTREYHVPALHSFWFWPSDFYHTLNRSDRRGNFHKHVFTAAEDEKNGHHHEFGYSPFCWERAFHMKIEKWSTFHIKDRPGKGSICQY